MGLIPILGLKRVRDGLFWQKLLLLFRFFFGGYFVWALYSVRILSFYLSATFKGSSVLFEHIENSGFLDSDILSISRDWWLRNDRDYLLLYKLAATGDAFSWPLPPQLAVFVALLGERVPVSKLIEDINFAFSLDSLSCAADFVKFATDQLNSSEQIILRNEIPERGIQFNPAKYFIPIDNYRLPQDKRLRRPTHVRLSIGLACQTDCLYCYAERKAIPKKRRLPLERWFELVDEAMENEILNIDISGADPFADEITPSVTAYILQLGLPVFLSTKAVIEPHIVDELIEAGLNVDGLSGPSTIQLSIDSTIPEIADTLTGVTGYLDRADANVKLCLEREVRLRVKTVLTAINHDAIIPILKKYFDLGVRFFQFVQCGYSHFRDTSKLLLSDSQKREIIAISESLNHEEFPGAEIVIQAEEGTGTTPDTPEAWANRSRCSGGYSSMTVCPDGNVILCEQMPTTKEYVVGNVLNNNLMDVWNSDRLKKWVQPPIEAFRGTPCFACEEFKDCVHSAGWCYRDALFAYGRMHTAPPRCPKQLAPAKRLL